MSQLSTRPSISIHSGDARCGVVRGNGAVAFSLIVAMLAGVAGVLALTSAKSASLVGVFISVTTVPAAGFVAVALVEGRLDRAASSALQLVVNLVGIVVAATLGLLVARAAHRRRLRARPLSAG